MVQVKTNEKLFFPLFQECRCQRRTAAQIARKFAVKFSGEYVLLQAHYKGNEAAETSTSSAASKNDAAGKLSGKLAAGKKN